MKTIFELCLPRKEVTEGSLSQDIFAARLKDVMDGVGDDVYKDPRAFFENTFPTSGLKTLLNDALGRMVGDATGTNAILRLETAFGGGKSHNLIALYHVASGKAPAQVVEKFTGISIPKIKPGDIKIAGVVGSDLDPMLGMSHPDDGITTYTLWGELAYQLGGSAGYALVQESDRKKIAPGTGLFEALVGNRPTLIMLDEVARHLRAALAVSAESGKTTLADQTVAFMMSLLEFAASKERCLVVLTLAGETDAFAKETEFLRQKLAETLQVSARQERVLTPTTENEVYSIVTHRLFKSVDRAKAKSTLERYARYYAEMAERNTELPQKCLRAEYLQELTAAYPFHPELLATLSLKTSTIPNFNQTRGALRLLAYVVRNLWEKKKDGTWLIHTHHLDLSHAGIADDLTSHLDRPNFKQVIEADILSSTAGTFAHAQELDQPLISSKKPPYATRLGTTIFLHSLTQGIASGVDPADLMLSVLEPAEGKGGDDSAVVTRSLERLTDQAWFLEYDGHRYRFKTEPSINKIIADETLQVGTSKAKVELETRIKQIWKKGFFQPVYFPVQSVDIDDDAGLPKLAIMHFDALKAKAGSAKPGDMLRKLYDYKGTQESFRTYQNNIMFLVADEEQAENMINVARRYLAIGRIVGDAERMAVFNKEQKEKLKGARDTAELDVRVAITKAYRYLYYPSTDAAKADSYLRRENLPAQEQGDVDKDQTNVILRVLRSLKKVQTAEDETLPAQYVKSKAWDLNQENLSTEELRRAFARKIGLRMLLDINQLRRTIQNGVQTGVWVYYDAREEFGYDKDSLPPVFQIAEETHLYLPEAAKKMGMHIKGKWTPARDTDVPGKAGETEAICPVCGRPESQCICGVGKSQRPAKLTGEGAVLQAFEQIVDTSTEHKASRLSRLFITIDGVGAQMAGSVRSLGLAVPQFGKGQFAVELDALASYGKGEMFKQEFRGGWDRYKRLKSVVEPFLQEADELKVKMRVACTFDGGLDPAGAQFNTIRDVLSTLDLGRVMIEAVPEYEN
jgi:hypothetical protein